MSACIEAAQRRVMNDIAYQDGNDSTAKEVSIWNRASTFPVLAALIYMAMSGQSPFVNDDIYLRFSNAGPDTSVLSSLIAWSIYLVCALAIVTYRTTIITQFFRLKALAMLPLLAIVSSCWSQAPLFSLHRAILLLGATLFAVYFVCRFTSREQMQFLMSCGAITAIASILFAVLLPRYGLDRLGGHEHAWKGIFTAKNVCGQTMLLFLTPALYYRARSGFTKVLQSAYIVLLIGVIIMSQAATSWIFLGLLLAFRFGARLAASFALRDMLILLALFSLLLATLSLAAFENHTYLLAMLGKDSTLTGRTGLWTAAMTSVGRSPILGYGYQAFWLGLTGESANVLLSIKNFLSQPQNGFLDVWLQLGLGGIVLIIGSLVAAGRDLLGSRHARRVAFVQWYAVIVILTVLFNMVETYLLTPSYIGWLLYLCACYGLNDTARRRRKAQSVQAYA
jgi:O-antigen ligase